MLLASTRCLCSDLVKMHSYNACRIPGFCLQKFCQRRGLQGDFKMILFLCPTQVSVMMETPTW